ncbi:hypothetical protein P700755_001220 [Psychroflexus torquis ATCC 700755]|uniref:Uncharacterized protein n=1 Tax=Psychroflexus torquis (strain ATCC 700755 / CIP 106069 / ACAM 623) TaxID=313595 RepID=K4IE84_PSYTT|nr:hypothetical protein P700755_001220 [Psychroflexus torquis ATCC 700755]
MRFTNEVHTRGSYIFNKSVANVTLYFVKLKNAIMNLILLIKEGEKCCQTDFIQGF